MACKIKDKFKALMYLKQILRAGMPRSWAKPNKIRKSLDLEPTRKESRRHAYLSPRNDYMTRIRIFTSKKKEDFGFRKENSVLPMLSTVPEKSGKCEQNENFREIAIKYGWLKGLRSKIVAKWRKKCGNPKSCNSHSTVRMTSKNYMSQMYGSSMEVSSDVINQQMIHKPDLQTLYNLKRCRKKKNDVNVIDLTKKSKYFTQPCPCGNLFSCGRVLGINGCQGTIILFLTMKSLVDVLLAFTVSISRGYMSGWQIPLQLFRIIGMATVALTATSLSEKARAGIWTMNAVCLEDLDDKSARQLNQLIIQLTASPVEVTASGYFSLTKGFLISIMSVIATYVIIIIQFKLSEA
ncbi:uncharacterized protein LOC124169412 [Ischnura elegans]|uniref:uncharacterized protein LOC124169412 n=1 Tax=Ischnura elegans TaxID=197161 RepID=UPI001ED8BC4C|nr:uncharacterized protein LOC124169412 [Ischnura elegans]